LGIDDARVNVLGSGCSLGHPIAMTGARMVMTLVHELRRRGGGTGVATMGRGGGMRTAVLLRVPASAARSRPKRGTSMRDGGRGGSRQDLRPELRVEQEADPIRTDLHLLARVRFRNAKGEDCECFASIVELGPRTGRIESGQPLEKGSPVKLQLV